MERTRELKEQWSEINLKIQHKSGAILIDENYEKINRLLLTPFYENRAIDNFYEDLIEWIIEDRKKYYDSL